MDKVAKGMSQAARESTGKPAVPSQGMAQKARGLAKDTMQKVGEYMENAGRKIKKAAH